MNCELAFVICASDATTALRLGPAGLEARPGWPFASYPLSLDVVAVDGCQLSSAPAQHALTYVRATPEHLHTVLLRPSSSPPAAAGDAPPQPRSALSGVLWKLDGEGCRPSPPRGPRPWGAWLRHGGGGGGRGTPVASAARVASGGRWTPARFLLDAARCELRRYRAAAGSSLASGATARARWVLPLAELLSVDVVMLDVPAAVAAAVAASTAPAAAGRSRAAGSGGPVAVAAIVLGLADGGSRTVLCATPLDTWRWAAALLTASRRNRSPAAAAHALIHAALAAHSGRGGQGGGWQGGAEEEGPGGGYSVPPLLFPARGAAADCMRALLARELHAMRAEAARMAAQDAEADAHEHAALVLQGGVDRHRGRLDLDIAARVWEQAERRAVTGRCRPV